MPWKEHSSPIRRLFQLFKRIFLETGVSCLKMQTERGIEIQRKNIVMITTVCPINPLPICFSVFSQSRIHEQMEQSSPQQSCSASAAIKVTENSTMTSIIKAMMPATNLFGCKLLKLLIAVSSLLSKVFSGFESIFTLCRIWERFPIIADKKIFVKWFENSWAKIGLNKKRASPFSETLVFLIIEVTWFELSPKPHSSDKIRCFDNSEQKVTKIILILFFLIFQSSLLV